MSESLTIWTIYDHPRDYPDKWVLRSFAVGSGSIVATGAAVTADSLDAVRAHLPPGLVRLSRNSSDDPVIYESWI